MNINISELVGPQLARLQRMALIAALVGLVLCVLGLIVNARDLTVSAQQFFVSYLTAFMLVMGFTGGSLAWLMIGHVTGGGVAIMLRRMLEASTRTLPFVFAMWVPIAIAAFLSAQNGHHGLFEWADPKIVSADRLLTLKSPYLNVPAFVIRGIFYFLIWGTLAAFLNKWSRTQDEKTDPEIAARLNYLSAVGLLTFVLTMTFASFDWIMSLTPHWYSSLFGAIIIVGQGLSTLALMAVLINALAGHTKVISNIESRYFRDLGNLTLAFTLLWAYLNFSQFMLIWSGNIAEEVTWYTRRTQTSWLIIGVILSIGHFILPFFVLLSSSLKVKIQNLSKLALFIVLMRALDLWFYIAPSFRPELTGRYLLSDIGAFLLLGGLWLFLWARELKGRQLVPVYDPRLQEHLPLLQKVMQNA